MKLVIFGASGATGRHLVRLAVQEGHQVVVCVRPDKANSFLPEQQCLTVEPDNQSQVREALMGADAVAVCLGISRKSRSPFASIVSPTDLTSRSMAIIIAAMSELNVRRIVYLSAYGAGASWKCIPWWGRIFIRISNIHYSIDDHTRSEQLLVNTNLEWTVLRPMMLNELPSNQSARKMQAKDSLLTKIPREAVARTFLNVLCDQSTFKCAIALSAPD